MALTIYYFFKDVENGTKRVRVDDTVLLAPPRLRRSSFDEDGLAGGCCCWGSDLVKKKKNKSLMVDSHLNELPQNWANIYTN